MSQETNRGQISQLTSMLSAASSITVFTGAGISTESGIADFRSPGGIWSRIKPIQFDDFLKDEETRLEDWRRRFHFQAEFDAAPVNDGHRAVARISNCASGHGVITQNIDGLHQRSGVDEGELIEIHGNGTRCACLECGSAHTLDAARAMIEETGTSPRCTRCSGLLKASVISFGQSMPRDRVEQAIALAQSCDLFIVLGSSLVVQPAASLPEIAVRSCAQLVIVNREPTHLDHQAQLVISGSIGAHLWPAVEQAFGP